MGGSNSEKQIEEVVYKLKAVHKPSGAMAVGASIKVVLKGIIIVGTENFRATVSHAFEELINGNWGNKLLTEIFTHIGNATLYVKETLPTEGSGYDAQAPKYFIKLDVQSVELKASNGANGKPIPRKPVSALAHELEHFRQSLLNVKDLTRLYVERYPTKPDDWVYTVAYADLLAIYVENLVRGENSLPLRTDYNSVNVYNKRATDTYKLMKQHRHNNSFTLCSASDAMWDQDINYANNVYLLDSQMTNKSIVKFTSTKRFRFNVLTLGTVNIVTAKES